MNKISFFLAIALSPLFLFAQKGKKVEDPLAGIDKELEAVLKDRKAVGFAVAVVKKDQVIYSKGFGYRDYENKKPVTPNTLFAIGSSTKAFTTSLLGMMQKEGALEFTDLATKHLPELKFKNPSMNNEVTITDIITHRTGLPRYDFSWYLFNSSSRDSLLSRIEHMETTARLREQFQYNNFMYLVQGMIAEKHYGKKWESLIEEKIFKPLQMQRSTTDINKLKTDDDAAKGYYVEDSLIKPLDYYNIGSMGPAGSINSSVNEMTQWLMTWINNGKFNDQQVLPESYIRQAYTSRMVASAGLPGSNLPDSHMSNYGFGWFINSYRGHYRVEHGGNIDGFTASVAFYPTDSVGIVVLANQNGSEVNALVRNLIADRLFKLPFYDWNGEANKREKETKDAAAKQQENSNNELKKITGNRTHELQDYTGLYSHPAYGTLEVALQNDSLFALFPSHKYWLRHAYYDIFESFPVAFLADVDSTTPSSLYFPFQMNLTGAISGLRLTFSGGKEELFFPKTSKPTEIAADELEKYVGEYELAPGAIAKVYVKNKKLHVFLDGQPEYELIAVGNHKFDLKIVSGFSVQFFEDNDKINELHFVQPNGTFKAKKIK